MDYLCQTWLECVTDTPHGVLDMFGIVYKLAMAGTLWTWDGYLADNFGAINLIMKSERCKIKFRKQIYGLFIRKIIRE